MGNTEMISNLMKKRISLAFLSLVLLACNTKIEPPKAVTINDLYSVEIPSNLAPLEALQENASLQYGNKFKEVYTVVIDEDKESFNKAADESGKKGNLTTYAQETLTHYEGTRNFNLIESSEETIHNLPAKIYEITAKVNGIDLYYYLGVVEGKAHYYRIINWTLEANKEAQRENMDKVLKSFKEI